MSDRLWTALIIGSAFLLGAVVGSGLTDMWILHAN